MMHTKCALDVFWPLSLGDIQVRCSHHELLFAYFKTSQEEQIL